MDRRILHTYAAVGILIVFLSVESFAQVRVCTIKNLIGSVKIRRGESSSWIDAKPKMPVRERDALRTFIESGVELETSEGSIIKIGENSTLELAKLLQRGAVQSTRIKVLNGSVVASIKKLMDAQSSFDFETPTALASIRGTLLGLAVTAERTEIKVYEGRVLVIPVDAREGKELTDNQMTSITRGQKTVEIQKLEEKPPISAPDTTIQPVDSTARPPHDSLQTGDSLKQQGRLDSAGSSITRPAVMVSTLHLSVGSPANNQHFIKPLIPVQGNATPGAEVVVSPPGVRILVPANGTFATNAPIPDESGEYRIEIQGTFGGATQTIVRNVTYRPEFQFVLVTPQNRQTVASTMFPVKGTIFPAKNAQVVVLGRKMTIAADGTFNGMVSIPDEEGEVQLDFEASAGGVSQTITRTIIYKRAVDIYAPVIQASLPRFAKQRQLCIPVYDRTVGDEVTFFYQIDGARDYQKGAGSATYCFNLEPGIHEYVVWAEDKARNQSQRLSERIAYLETSRWYIKLRRPAGEEIITLPPMPPDASFQPTYTVDFSIENLPNDDMRLIREVRVINQTAGTPPQTQSVFTDHYLNFDVPLKPGKSNVIVIEVQDCNANKKVVQCLIHLK